MLTSVSHVDMRLCSGEKGKASDRPDWIDEAQMKVSREEKQTLIPSASLWPPANTKPELYCTQRRHIIKLVFQILHTTARFLRGTIERFSELRTWYRSQTRYWKECSQSNKRASLPRHTMLLQLLDCIREGKLTRTLNHIICRCLFSFPLLLLCEWQLLSSSSSSLGKKTEDGYRLLHWEMW